MSSNQKFLVIGSNGQIGTVLTNKLAEKYGYENVVGSDLRPPKKHTKFIFEECSVLDFKRLSSIISKYNITGSSKNKPDKNVEVVIIDIYELIVKLF